LHELDHTRFAVFQLVLRVSDRAATDRGISAAPLVVLAATLRARREQPSLAAAPVFAGPPFAFFARALSHLKTIGRGATGGQVFE
jgi:hypothetical protein